MPYENIPGVGAAYLDGAFATVQTSDQPRILILGAAPSGISYELFQIQDMQQAEEEFGSASELMQGVHEALSQGADNIACMRIGGRRGSVVLEDADGGTLTIRPELRDAEALRRYALILTTNAAGEQRILIRDTVSLEWIYDSEDILVLDIGLVEVIDGGLALRHLGDINNPDNAALSPRLEDEDGDDLAETDFLTDVGNNITNRVPAGGVAWANANSITVTPGDDGLTMTQMERYAALAEAYQFMDYRDADYVVPMGVFQDTPNAADNLVHGIPTDLDDIILLNRSTAAGGIDGLLHCWKTVHRGKPYVFFLDRSDTNNSGGIDAGDGFLPIPNPPGSVTFHNNGNGPLAGAAAAWAIRPVTLRNGPIHIVHADLGVGGGNPTFAIAPNTPAAGETTITISLEYGASSVLGGLLPALAADNAANALISIVDAEPGGAASAGAMVAIGDAVTAANVETSTQITVPVVSHADLTGDEIPVAVWDKLDAAENAEVREVNFAHQLATAMERASTTWSTMLGMISVGEPPAYSRAAVAEWVGEEPEYSFTGAVLSVENAAANGEGLLGNKFHAGAASYRTHLVTEGAANEGVAYGGYIRTGGTALSADEPYGVSADDEALDAKAAPVDLGKHIFVCASWPVLSNGFDGGSQYRGTLCGVLAGKFAVTPENIEPIGMGGFLANVRRPPRMRAPLVNSLAKLRYVSTRREEGVGHILVSVKTAAHPNSDYTRLSTIRCVNREITGIRNICRPYIGKEFSSRNLQAMQTAIDGFLRSEQAAGFNQGAIAKMEYTRTDKIMGRLRIRLKMIPPFSIEAITIETTLAAEEAELKF